MKTAQAPVTTQTMIPAGAPDRPGKSAQSIGNLAKQAVAAARQAGADMPANSQGVAASQIAQGADPASIFAAVAEPADPAETGELTDPATPADGAEPYLMNADAVSAETSDSAETALALLTVDEHVA